MNSENSNDKIEKLQKEIIRSKKNNNFNNTLIIILLCILLAVLLVISYVLFIKKV